MITAEMEAKPVVDDLDGDSEDDYEYVYQQELFDKWVKCFDDMELQIARGELKPQTVEEFAAEMGLENQGRPHSCRRCRQARYLQAIPQEKQTEVRFSRKAITDPTAKQTGRPALEPTR